MMKSKKQRHGTKPRTSRWVARRRQARLDEAERRAQRQADKITVLYGSVYLDQGETIETAIEQIDALIGAQNKPANKLAVGMDIVCTPAQIQNQAGHTIANQVLSHIDKYYPALYVCSVGITDDDNRRPVRDALDTGNIDVDNVHLFLVEGH